MKRTNLPDGNDTELTRWAGRKVYVVDIISLLGADEERVHEANRNGKFLTVHASRGPVLSVKVQPRPMQSHTCKLA